MTSRIQPQAVAPQAIEAMLVPAKYVRECGLEHSLQHLVMTRASQINGCVNCLHMHTAEARKAGETEERIYVLTAWRESLLFTPRERAALAWTEALTLLPETHAPDADYEALQAHFTPKEQVDLTMLIGLINAFNRLAVGFRVVHPNDRKGAEQRAG